MERDDLDVEIVYARADEQVVITLCVPRGTTAGEAIVLSGLPARYIDFDPAKAQVGIYGRRVELDIELAAGDRVEIYRPLVADPKLARRRRASNSR
jgi:putative ubiquitin-RnfH superfamily antitoxin RatB of RatAB toxin-antitoxin module